MSYTKLFAPLLHAPAGTGPAPSSGLVDNADPFDYVFTDDIILAVNVALASGRPLLVRGPSGVGKSSLAAAVAAHMDRALHRYVVNGETRAQDFLWHSDDLKRLRDAQKGAKMDRPEDYITPGALFWGFDPKAAKEVLTKSERSALVPERSAGPSVVLIDEIDKADPDVPNGLLEPLGALSFDVPDLNKRITALTAPLIVITTNEERDLPLAFLRRCVELSIEPPAQADLVNIATKRFPDMERDEIIDYATQISTFAQASNLKLSTAEFIDTLNVAQSLQISSDDALFEAVVKATALKAAGGGGQGWSDA